MIVINTRNPKLAKAFTTTVNAEGSSQSTNLQPIRGWQLRRLATLAGYHVDGGWANTERPLTG